MTSDASIPYADPSTTVVAVHDDHGHGAHTPGLAHHFDDIKQQHEAGTLGMWAFLATEIMFFGAAFVAYTIYRHMYGPTFVSASKHLYWTVGAVNTGVLLGSSLSVAFAVYAAATGQNKLLIRSIIITMVLATAFLGVKATEYYIDWKENLTPLSDNFGIPKHYVEEHPEVQTDFNARLRAMEEEDWSSPDDSFKKIESPDELAQVVRRGKMFFAFYFIVTGIHATHMVIGLGLFLWLLWKAKKNEFTPQHHAGVEMVGLYWHFVDVVWIFVFPLMYLIRV